MFSSTSLLIIEDQPEICELIKLSFLNQFHSVQTAHSVADAVTCVKKSSFALAIVDTCLPDGDPYSVIQKLVQKKCRILLMSGNFQINQQIGKLPFQKLEKPFRIKELIQKVEETLQAPLTTQLAPNS